MKEKMVNKIHGCLVGLATGDAMGMAGLSSFQRTVEIHGAELTTFISPSNDPAIDPVHYLLPRGTVTDDTFGAVAIVDAIINRGEISLDTFVESNISWVTYADALSYGFGRDRGLAGPSTSAAIKKLRSGVSPYETGKNGTTNGSAARVPPIGFLFPGDLDATVDAAELSCIPTHNTNVAISATAAVACAISVIAAGETSIDAILDAAKRGAEMGKTRGNIVYSPSVAKRIDLAVRLASSAKDKRRASQDIYDLIGSDLAAYEVVPASFGAFALGKGDPVDTILAAINICGDSDTLGAIAGALIGALRGFKAFPPEYEHVIEEANNLKLAEKAERFYAAIQLNPPIVN